MKKIILYLILFCGITQAGTNYNVDLQGNQQMQGTLTFKSTNTISALDSSGKILTMDLLSKSTYQSIIELHYSSITITQSLINSTTIYNAIDSNDKIVLHFNGTNNSQVITDSATTPLVWTAHNNAKIDTSTFTFGGACLKLDVYTTDYISTPDNDSVAFGNGDWTIDFWANIESIGTALVNTNAYVFSQYEGPYDMQRLYFTKPADTLYLTYEVYQYGISVPTITLTTTFSEDVFAWTNYALVRYGNRFTIYCNGVEKYSTIASTSIKNFTGEFNVGYHSDAGALQTFNGYIDEFHVNKGSATHTTNYTPNNYEYNFSSTTVSTTNISTTTYYTSRGIFEDTQMTGNLKGDGYKLFGSTVQFSDNSKFNTAKVYNYGFENYIVTDPIIIPALPTASLTVTLPAITAIVGNANADFPSQTVTLSANEIRDLWGNSNETITISTETSSTYTNLPNYSSTKIHLWRLESSSITISAIYSPANTFPITKTSSDTIKTIDNFSDYFYISDSTVAWVSGSTVTYGQLIQTSNNNIYQVYLPGYLGNTELTSTAAGNIVSGTATLYFYSRTPYLGMFRYTVNGGIENYFTNIGLKYVINKKLKTGSPLGEPAGTLMSTLVKKYILGMFKHCIAPRILNGNYQLGMKMTQGNYIWECTQAGLTTGNIPAEFAGSHTVNVSTMTDGTVAWKCIYDYYGTAEYFWLNTDRTFQVYSYPDSHDSYASTFFSLLARYIRLTDDYSWISDNSPLPINGGYLTYKEVIDEIYYYNISNQISNFLTKTFQGDIHPLDGSAFTTQYLEDNCESYQGLKDLSYIYDVLVDTTQSASASDNATYVASGIYGLYNTTYTVFNVYYGEDITTWVNKSNLQFYPYLQCQMFPEFYNVENINQDMRNNARLWVGNNLKGWWNLKSKDIFPQCQFAYLSVKAWQDSGRAYSILDITNRYFLGTTPTIISEFGYYLATKDILTPNYNILDIKDGEITIEDGVNNISKLHTKENLLVSTQTWTGTNTFTNTIVGTIDNSDKLDGHHWSEIQSFDVDKILISDYGEILVSDNGKVLMSQ